MPLADDLSIKAAIKAKMLLKDIHCPSCKGSVKVEEMKLRTATGFSKVMCKDPECKQVSYSNQWRCRCQLLWTKWPRHVHMHVASTKRPKKMATLKTQREADFWRQSANPEAPQGC